jgi:hypothetical protein
MTTRLAVAFLLLTARLASADPEDAKSPGVGLALSAGGTAASIGLIAGGLAMASAGRVGNPGLGVATVGFIGTLVTPSFGEWYAGKYLTAGLGLRLLGTTVAAIGVSKLAICFDDCGGEHINNSGAGTAIALGLVTYAAGIVVDVATAPSTVRESNARRHAVIKPSILTSPSGGAAYGLGLGGNF